MKKQYLSWVIIPILVFTLTACSKPAEEIEVAEQTIEDAGQTEKPTLDGMTIEELYNMSDEDAMELMKTTIPEWKTVFKIPEGTTITPDQYSSFHELFGYYIFGADYLKYKTELLQEKYNESHSDINILTEVTDSSTTAVSRPDDWIYVAPTADYLNSLTLEEYAKYLEDMYKYFGYNIESGSFSQIPDEELEKIRQEQIAKSSYTDEQVDAMYAEDATEDKAINNPDTATSETIEVEGEADSSDVETITIIQDDGYSE
jgi:hypothetical protein